MSHGCSGVWPVMWEAFVHNCPTNRPVDVLDLGCGWGLMGAEVWANRRLFGNVALWGVDAEPANRNSMWYLYDQVIEADLTEWVPQTVAAGRTFDVGFLFEVLEHLPRESGEALLPLLPPLAPVWFLSTPDVLFPTGKGPYNSHVSLWSAEDLRGAGFRLLQPPGFPSWRALGWPMHFAVLGPWSMEKVLCVRDEGPGLGDLARAGTERHEHR